MQTATADSVPGMTQGDLLRIDLIDRQVTVRQASGPVTYSVPPICEVLLNGERVKLRMLQPHDHVRVAYRRRAEGRVALSVEAVTRKGRAAAERDG